MTYNNQDSRQRFARLKSAVEAIPGDDSTGTGWRAKIEPPKTDNEPINGVIPRSHALKTWPEHFTP